MLIEKIKKDINDAMKAGDKDKVSCLRVLMSALKNKEIALRKALDEPEVISIIRTEIKQVTESYEQFKAGGRTDLADKEQASLKALNIYLPQELSDEELTSIIEAIIFETQATKKDFGKVMKLIIAKVEGRADGKRINSIVGPRLQ